MEYNKEKFSRPNFKEGIQKAQEYKEKVQEQLEEGRQQAGRVMEALDEQVRENPWPVIAGVAAASFILGALFSRSR